jgi:uroporphyrinogen decarboxylase
VTDVVIDAAQAPFLRACRREPVPHTPVWFMRQAGRSLPEYRKVRAGISMLDSCARPDLVTEITLQPVRRLGVDAAILYSDIVVPVRAVGVDLDIKPGVGPVVDQPFRGPEDVRRLRPLEPEADVPYVLEAVRQLVAESPVPVIGFAGAPFTLASYLVEGGPSKTHARTKAAMYADPEGWAALMDALADLTVRYLRAQVEAGVHAVQLFDSWAGTLSALDYKRFVLPSSRRIFAGLADLGVPRIHFGVNTGELLGLMAEAGPDVVGVDFHVPLDWGARRIGPGWAVQGNLDPAALLAPWEACAERVRDVLARAAGLPGHVFNLGHGVLPETDPDQLRRVVDLVHEETAGG